MCGGMCRERSTGHGFWKMKSRILEGRLGLAGHEKWTVGARTLSRILRGMAASFVREVGHGFGCDGARKVNERVVLEVSVDAGRRSGRLRVAGVRVSDFGRDRDRKGRSCAVLSVPVARREGGRF